MEASLGLFLFLLFFIGILYFYQVMNMEVRIQEALENTASTQVAYYSLGKERTDELSFVGCQLNYGYVALCMVQQLKRDYLDASWIQYGSGGFDYSGCEFLKDKATILLKVSYRIRLPFFGNLTIPISQQTRKRVWIGDDSSSLKESAYSAYITPNGTAYHLYDDCSYIHYEPVAVPGSKIELIRNDDGAIYHPCERCNPTRDGTVYVTYYGTRYHSSTSCTAIERNVQKISLDEVGGRHLCQKCAKRNHSQ